jgi:hypothetical protein
MKKLFLAAALSTVAVGSAFAYAPNELAQTFVYEVSTLVPGADTSNLTTDQVGRIETVLTSSSYDESEKAGAIKVILGLN